MKLVKWIFIIVFVLVVAAVATVGVVVANLDPNEYKPQIQQVVKEKTGRDLDIPGDIGWSIFPWLGLNLGDTRMANAPGFSGADFAAIEEVDVHVELLPLLKKQVNVKTVVLRGLQVNLQKNASGQDNWTDLQQATAADEAATEEDGGVLNKIELRVEGVELENASFTYKDAQANTDLNVGPVNLRTGALEFGESVPVEMDLAMTMNNAMQLASEMKGELTIDPGNEVFRLVSSLNADVSQKQEGVTLSSDIKGQLEADVFAGAYNVAGLSLDAKLVNPSFPKGLPLDLKADVSANTSSQKMSLKNVVIQVADLNMRGGIEVNKFLEAPNYSGTLKGADFNPRKVMQTLGMAVPITKSDDALTRSNFEMTINGTASRVALKPLQATLDSSTLNGEVSITDLAKQAVRFDLVLDQFNADEYLPPVTEASAKDAGVAVSDVKAVAASDNDQMAANDVILLPVDVIKGLDIKGTAKLNQLILNKLTFSDASLTLNADNGVVNIAPLRANAYQGQTNISAKLDVNSATPRYDLDLDVSGVRSEEILQILFGDKLVSGAAFLNAKVGMQGNSVSVLKQSMQGNYQLRFTEGTIHGSKLAAKLLTAQNAVNKLLGKPEVTDDTPDETEFSLLSASGPINNGILRNDDLKVESPRFDVTGAGEVRFPASELDYKVRLAFAEKEGGNNFNLPLRIHGPFDDLSYGLKLDDLAKQALNVEKEKLKAEAQAKLDAEKEAARQRLEEEKTKALEKVEEKKEEIQNEIKDKLGDALGDLFGGQ